MPSPQSPLRLFAARLAAASPLKAIRCPVLLGSPARDWQGSPPRIVLEPVSAQAKPASDQAVSLQDDETGFHAHLWAGPGAESATGYDLDAAWDLRVRFQQSLAEQAAGLPNSTAAGYFYETDSVEWNDATDGGEWGESLVIAIRVWFAIPSAPSDEGHVPGQWAIGEVDVVTVNPLP